MLTREQVEKAILGLSGEKWSDSGAAKTLMMLRAHDAALRATLEAAERELQGWQYAHVAGCPAIADDESDEVLTDCGVCTCVPLQQQLAASQKELERLKDAAGKALTQRHPQ